MGSCWSCKFLIDFGRTNLFKTSSVTDAESIKTNLRRTVGRIRTQMRGVNIFSLPLENNQPVAKIFLFSPDQRGRMDKKAGRLLVQKGTVWVCSLMQNV